MRRFLFASACLAPCLAACAPTTAPVSSAPAATPAQAATAATEPAAAPDAPATDAAKPQAATPQPSKPESAKPAPKPQPPGATISGAIRDGNRPPPALRVCAHPVAGGAPTCVESQAGATDYHMAVAPGRYVLMGWVHGGDLQLIAHATQIRCIRAPCPPDALIEVEVTADEEKTGIDLNGGYVDIPQGWPRAPG